MILRGGAAALCWLALCSLPAYSQRVAPASKDAQVAFAAGTAAVTGESLSEKQHPCLQITQVAHAVEPAGALARFSTAYSLECKHAGAVDAAGARGWIVGIKSEQEGALAAVERSQDGKKKSPLGIQRVGVDILDGVPVTYYRVALPRPAQGPGDLITVVLTRTASHASTPSPASLPQTAEALTMALPLDLLEPVAALVPPPGAKRALGELQDYRVSVRAPTPKVDITSTPGEHWESQARMGSATVSFVPKAVPRSYEYQPAVLKYVQPEPVVTIRTLERTIDASHLRGKLALKDEMDLTNSGAKLEGRFARIDHQRALLQRRETPLAVQALSLALPPRVSSPYFIDAVGNVSTSRFLPSDEGDSSKVILPSEQRRKKKEASFSRLDLMPRYPVMGGWSYSFTLGYDLPLADFASRRAGEHVLRVPFMTAVKDTAFDNVTTKVRLPEGATNIQVLAPFPLDTLYVPSERGSLWGTSEGYVKTFLDTTGRPEVTMHKQWCSDQHAVEILITYELPWYAMLQKPVAAALVLFALYATAVFFQQIDLSIR